jgi:hypothetical protein
MYVDIDGYMFRYITGFPAEIFGIKKSLSVKKITRVRSKCWKTALFKNLWENILGGRNNMCKGVETEIIEIGECYLFIQQ